VKREIIFYKDYFKHFYLEQTEKVQEKIAYVMTVIRTVDRIPEKFLTHITGKDGLYEMRVEYGSNIYRIFCVFDEGQLVVLLNGFHKKTQKTPPKEIEKAERLKKEYKEKKKNDKK